MNKVITKFLNNSAQGLQEIPLNILRELYPTMSKLPENVQEKSNKWLLLKYGETPDGLEWQIAMQYVFHPSNLVYSVYIFGKDGRLAAFLPVSSLQSIPPLYEKTFGIDYYDYIYIQNTINAWLRANSFEIFQIDNSPKGKMVYLLQEPAEIAIEKMNKGEQYNIVSLMAEAFLEKLK